jgi:hypothetical protein
MPGSQIRQEVGEITQKKLSGEALKKALDKVNDPKYKEPKK